MSYLLTPADLGRILTAWRAGKRSMDLSLDLAGPVSLSLEPSEALFPDGSRLPLEGLEKLRERNLIFLLDRELKPLEIRAQRYYKLVSTGPGQAPTLEIDGVRMHRTKGLSPERDAELKARAAGVKRCSRALDTCAGLGYTAIACLKLGACSVTAVEVDSNVLELAKVNPCSRRLFEEVELILGDVVEVSRQLPSGSFDSIIHDPPRFSLAGELYGRRFYAELFRLLRPGGRLFHYVGAPGERYRRKDLAKGVGQRLRAVGFEVELRRDLRGVVAHKP